MVTLTISRRVLVSCLPPSPSPPPPRPNFSFAVLPNLICFKPYETQSQLFAFSVWWDFILFYDKKSPQCSRKWDKNFVSIDDCTSVFPISIERASIHPFPRPTNRLFISWFLHTTTQKLGRCISPTHWAPTHLSCSSVDTILVPSPRIDPPMNYQVTQASDFLL